MALIKSISGIRGTIGGKPGENLTPVDVVKFAAAFGCIISENKSNCNRFLHEVDAAAVYMNASTRFTDGEEFGLGAEIGISTQKLHARGPFALEKLVTEKWIIKGNGQIR